jgi:hypothetical protein
MPLLQDGTCRLVSLLPSNVVACRAAEHDSLQQPEVDRQQPRAANDASLSHVCSHVPASKHEEL